MRSSLYKAIVTLTALLALASTALAQSAQVYDLSWWTVDSGGRTFSAGGGYTLGGTLGQPDAGALVGGEYALQGGFWLSGSVAVQHSVYLPPVLSGAEGLALRNR